MNVAKAVWDNTDKVPCEAFLVMSNRRDEALPTYEKTCGDKWFHSQEDAQRVCETYNKEYGPYYGVYRAIIVVEERVG